MQKRGEGAMTLVHAIVGLCTAVEVAEIDEGESIRALETGSRSEFEFCLELT